MFAFLPWPHLPIPFVSPFQARNQTQSTCKGYRQTERERERERDAQILSLSWLPISFGVSAAPTKAISPLRDTFTVAISTNCHSELLLQTQFFFFSRFLARLFTLPFHLGSFIMFAQEQTPHWISNLFVPPSGYLSFFFFGEKLRVSYFICP
jgi:hypothetical protein